MSIDLIVYMQRSRMPTPTQWQAEISREGFPIEIDESVDVDTFTGFLPCKYKGSISGFEYYSGPTSVEETRQLEFRDSDFSITLVVHAGHNEIQTAIGAASALCVASGGFLVDPQSGDTIRPAEAIAWARSAIEECVEDEV